MDDTQKPTTDEVLEPQEVQPEPTSVEEISTPEVADSTDTPVVEEAEQVQEETVETPVEAETEAVETPEETDSSESEDATETPTDDSPAPTEIPAEESPAKWYVVHTYSGHENRVSEALKQRIESEHLEEKILEVLVPTQDKIEIRGGKKETVKEKIFPGYILVKMVLDDAAWLAVRTTQGVTSFVGMGNKPTPIPEHEVKSIVSFMEQGAQPTYKAVYNEGDTVKIVDGPFSEFIGKVDSVDKDRGKVRVLVSIFGRETPVELDFLQVQKL